MLTQGRDAVSSRAAVLIGTLGSSPVRGSAVSDGVGDGCHQESGTGPDVENPLAGLGREEREDLLALLDDVRGGVEALDLASRTFVELEHRHLWISGSVLGPASVPPHHMSVDQNDGLIIFVEK